MSRYGNNSRNHPQINGDGYYSNVLHLVIHLRKLRHVMHESNGLFPTTPGVYGCTRPSPRHDSWRNVFWSIRKIVHYILYKASLSNCSDCVVIPIQSPPILRSYVWSPSFTRFKADVWVQVNTGDGIKIWSVKDKSKFNSFSVYYSVWSCDRINRYDHGIVRTDRITPQSSTPPVDVYLGDEGGVKCGDWSRV